MTAAVTESEGGCCRHDETPPAPPDRRRRVLALLRDSEEPCSVAQLARDLDVHVNTVRFHLDALAADGLIERADDAPRGPGRPPLRYRARRVMDPNGPRNFQLLAAILAEHFAAEPDAPQRAIEAGQAWGARITSSSETPTCHDDAVARLVALLDELGFQPETVTGAPARIALRHCPFLELADTRAEVVCPIHLGLMQGALRAMGADTTVEKLEPFVEPDVCMAHAHSAPKDSQ